MIIEGIPSGDSECFCLLVTKKTFEDAMGRKPDPKYDVGRYAKKGSLHRYMLYPCDLLGVDPGDRSLHLISIEAIKKKDLK